MKKIPPLLGLFLVFIFLAATTSQTKCDKLLNSATLIANYESEDDSDLFMDEAEEDTADVAEESMPVAEPEPKPMTQPKSSPPPTKRNPASFKQGFKTTAKNCTLHAEPNLGSKALLTSSGGKKLWLEGHNESWYKGFYSNGSGYFPAECCE